MTEKSYVATLRAIRDRLGSERVKADPEDRQRRVQAEIEKCPELALILAEKLREARSAAEQTESAPSASASNAARSGMR